MNGLLLLVFNEKGNYNKLVTDTKRISETNTMAYSRPVLKDIKSITPDDLLNWFKAGNTIPIIDVKGGTSRLPSDAASCRRMRCYQMNDLDHTSYAAKYIKNEETNLLNRAKVPENQLAQKKSSAPFSKMEEIDQESTISELTNLHAFEDRTLTDIYDNYNFTHRYNPNLIASNYREEIVRTINYHQVVIIEGATGSGKTTQVPQFILDYHREKNTPCNIIVSQPRRIAAVSNARRVCHERNWRVSELIGYHVGLDNKTSRNTRITYATTGVLLQKLVATKHLNNYTHVILDEVHERDQDMDFCILIVRKFLRTVSPSVKVVLMSATFDVTKFGEYFKIPMHGRLEMPIVIPLRGKSFSVAVHWLTELEELGELPEISTQSPMIQDTSYKICLELVKAFDKIEVHEQNCADHQFAPRRGSVLVFLPGLDEINRLLRNLNEEKTRCRWWVVPLHSSITSEEQARVFDSPQPGYRKIILATNIAESSITVPDIVYVVDFCLTKNLKCDMQTNYTRLELEWASKANCTQRKGRTGRVAPGRVYRLISEEFYDSLPDYNDPEMKRCPLEQIILKVKLLDVGEPRALLALALDPPNLGDIERTVLVLKEIGALDIECCGKVNAFDGDLTFVGRVLATLPTDVRVGRLMIFGFLFGCLEETIIIAAGLSMKSIFAKPYAKPLEAYNNKLAWSDQSFSDCIAILLAFKTWLKKKNDRSFTTQNSRNATDWARAHFIQPKKIKDVAELAEELTSRLEHFNIRKATQPLKNLSEAEETLILKIVLAGAFYPNYFIQRELDERDIQRTLSGKDPFTTVMVSGLPHNQGALYSYDIENLFSGFGHHTKIHFEDSKAYVEFLRPKVENSEIEKSAILPAVFSAVKMRMLRMPLEIYLLRPEEAAKQMEQLMQWKMSHQGRLRTNRITTMSESTIKNCPLPALHQDIIAIIVTEISRNGNMWARYNHDAATRQSLLLANAIQLAKAEFREIKSVITPGHFCLAPYQGEYYRARVEEVVGDQIKVFFIDYGNFEKVKRESLKEFDSGSFPDLIAIPAQAFECIFAGIEPTGGYPWATDAYRHLKKLIKDEPLEAEVYSIVQNVVRIILITMEDGERESRLNDQLCELGFAVHVEEPYQSQHDHKMRRTPGSRQSRRANDDECGWLELPGAQRQYKLEYSNRKLKLRGPVSPLEVSFTSLPKGSVRRQVRVETDSVNSVTLDCEPYDVCARMMVASSICLNPSGEVIVAHDTTLLPNIHNLPALVAMLFAPKAELRTDSKFCAYTGVLCGLGYDELNEMPLYEEHDMEIPFDTEIDDYDLKMINSIRTHIAWCLKQTSSSGTWADELIVNFQNPARKCLINLLSRPRRLVDKHYFIYPYTWCVVPPTRYREVSVTDAFTAAAEKSLIKEVILNQSFEEKLQLHVRLLHWMAENTIDFMVQECQLCHDTLRDRNELRLHLKTKDHREREQKYI